MRPQDLSKLTVAELRARLGSGASPPTKALERSLEADPRAGARALLREFRRRREEERAEERRLESLLRFEKELWERGVTHVAGADEAGMAPLAGPIVAGACILPAKYRPRGIDDSKRLGRRERERLARDVKENAVAWAVARAEVSEIDGLNVYQAGLLALTRAVRALEITPGHLLVDARRLRGLAVPQTPIVHGDALSMTIAAASILAKTERDAIMVELDAAHPGYGFARHKGYPTAEHFRALKTLGASPVHRRSFRPVAEAPGGGQAQRELFAPMAGSPRDGV